MRPGYEHSLASAPYVSHIHSHKLTKRLSLHSPMFGRLTREHSAEVTSHNGKTILLFLSVFIGNVLVNP